MESLNLDLQENQTSIKGIKPWKYYMHPNEGIVGKNEGIAYTPLN
jgi:hypothetical protein